MMRQRKRNQDSESPAGALNPEAEAPAGSPENPLELRFPVAIRREKSPLRPRLAAKSRSARSASTPRSRKAAGKSKSDSKSKKKSGPSTKSKRTSGKRDEVKTPTGTFYAKRTARGRFKEMDEKGRSLAADRRKKAKKKIGSGYGDQGDRPAKRK